MSSVPIVYNFGRFSLQLADKQLLCEGKRVPLAPKVYDTLSLLLESQGRLVEKAEFLNRLWPDSHVEEVSLAHAISQLRKALGAGTDGSAFIETVPKRGYRFLVPVEVVGPQSHQSQYHQSTPHVMLGVFPSRTSAPVWTMITWPPV